MRGKTYKKLRPTLAILTIKGKRDAITIPHSAVVTVLREPLDDSYLVEAKWENRAVRMFVTDLRESSTMMSQPWCLNNDRSPLREWREDHPAARIAAFSEHA
jgi:hypothetical protein